MFDYVTDTKYLRSIRSVCGEIMQDFCHILKEEYDIGANFYLIGSGGRNLITQNEDGPIDLDYNLEILRCENIKDCRTIKESARKAFNKALKMNGWNDCEDSTASLTTEKRVFRRGNPTAFSMDVGIVCSDTQEQMYRLIHEKTGWCAYDRYYWVPAPNSAKIREKAEYIKSNGQWELVRKQYLQLKNMYLRYNNHTHPSFICYIEAVNNVYNSQPLPKPVRIIF